MCRQAQAGGQGSGTLSYSCQVVVAMTSLVAVVEHRQHDSNEIVDEM